MKHLETGLVLRGIPEELSHEIYVKAEDMSSHLKTFYDQDNDILYLAREGEEEQAIEIHPGVNIELNKDGQVVGIEVVHASSVLKDIIEPLRQKARV